MGVLSSPQACKEITKMMKNVAVVALCLFAAAAVAEPEADAGYPYGHHGYYGHHYGKRSADAEPTAAAEADADAYYGYLWSSWICSPRILRIPLCPPRILWPPLRQE